MSLSAALDPAISKPADAGARAALPIAIGLAALALLLRLHDITAQSLWWDEVSSWQQARLDLGGLIAATAADNYPPLHNLLLHLSMALLGENAFALRLPSVILGAGSVLALYWTGSLVGGRSAGLIAAALLCVSGFHVWFSQEARMYALLCLTTIVYAGAALQVSLRPRWPWGVASVAAGALLLYSHPYGALNWASLTLAIGVSRWATRGSFASVVRFVLLQSIGLLLYLPWALVLLGRARVIEGAGFWLPQVTPGILLLYFEIVISGPALLVMALLAVALAALPPMMPHRKRLLDPIAPQGEPLLSTGAALSLLIAWAILPAALGTAISLLATPVLFHRYLIGSLPALLLLIGMGFARLPRNAVGFFFGLAGLATAAIIGLLHFSPGQRDDFRDVAADLATELRPGDCVVMSPESATAMSFYRPAGFACLATPRAPGDATFGGTQPTRTFLIQTAADQEDNRDTSALGRTVATRQFGVTRLLLITPK